MPSNTVRGVSDVDLAQAGPLGKRVRARAPLRLGLAGGGSDVSPFADQYGGLILNATIDQYCYATIQDGAQEPTFIAADLEVTAGIDSDPDQLALHRAVYERLDRDFHLGHPPLAITTACDAPPGSGLGSSSTLVVAMIEAFREYFRLPLGEYDVARLAFEIERVDCGLSGGRQDHYAATFGGFNYMEFGPGPRVLINPLRMRESVIQELEASLILFYSGTSRASADIIDQQVELVRSQAAAQLEATHALKAEAERMKAALLMGDIESAATVLRDGWVAKRQLANGISTDRLEQIFDVATRAGSLGGKVSGAGGGGYIIFLSTPEARPRVKKVLDDSGLGAVVPTHFVREGATAWTIL